MNRRMLHDAIAASVKEVSDAFEAGVANGADPSSVDRWTAAGLLYVGSTDGLSKRQAAENTCPLFRILQNGELQIRTSARTDLPRPAKATTHNWGSSLRLKMASELFPAFEDLAAARDLGQSDEDFKTAMGNSLVGTECTAYRKFKERRIKGSDDCCAVAGRSTPVWVTDTTQWGDTEVPQKWSASQDGKNKNKRITYFNECFITQKAVATGRKVVNGAKAVGGAVVSGVSTVGHAVVSGASTVGHAVVSGAKAVGSAAVDGLVAYGEMMAPYSGLV